MKRFIVKILALSVGVAVLYIPIYCLLASMHLVCPIPVYHDELRLTELMASEISRYKDVDILFVGSSQSYRGFDTRQFQDSGYYTFNMGTTSQRPSQSHVLLKRYLDEICPHFVVFAVSPVLMQPSKEATLDFIWSDFETDKLQWEITKLRMTLNSKSWYMFNMWVYNAFRHHVYNPIKRSITNTQPIERHLEGEEMIVDMDKYIKGGYAEKQGNLTCASQEPKEIVIEFDSEQIDYLKQCIYMVQARNIPFILVEPPLQPSCYANWKNHAEWEKIIAGYPYLNYNEPVFLNDTADFYDNGHMNKYGVKVFNSMFITYLKDSLHYMPNHKVEINEY